MQRAHRTVPIAFALLLLPLLVACGDEDNGAGPEVNPLVGTWNVTSVTLGGVEVAAGTDLSVTLTLQSDGTSVISVSGDETGFFCDGSANCTETGTYQYTDSTFTFCDPGCDESLDYTISGGTLRIFFTDDESQSPVVITAVRT